MPNDNRNYLLLILPAAIAVTLTTVSWMLYLLSAPHAALARALTILVTDAALLLFAVLLASKEVVIGYGFRGRFFLFFAVVAAVKNLLLTLASFVIAAHVEGLYFGGIMENAVKVLLTAVAIFLLVGIFTGRNPLSGRGVLYVAAAAVGVWTVTIVPTTVSTAILLYRMAATEGSGMLEETMALMGPSPVRIILSDIPSLLIAPTLGFALRLGTRAGKSV